MKDLSDEEEEQQKWQGHSSAQEEEKSETEEEERDVHLDEEERKTRLAVVHLQTGYSFMDERRNMTDEVIRGDDMQAHMEGDVPEVSMSVCNKEK